MEQELVDFSVNKWTKAGIRDDEMTASELSLQLDAFEDLIYVSKKPSFDRHKYDHCSSKWGVQFEMIKYCYDND
jgi:hypothetical protein